MNGGVLTVMKKNESKQSNKKKMGRPQFDGKNPEVVVQKLEQCFLLGMSDALSCKYAGISPVAMYHYYEKHPELSKRKDEFKANPFFKAHQSVIDSFDENPEMAMKYLERKLPAEFAPKQKIEGTIKHISYHTLITDLIENKEKPKIIQAEVVEDELTKED